MSKVTGKRDLSTLYGIRTGCCAAQQCVTPRTRCFRWQPGAGAGKGSNSYTQPYYGGSAGQHQHNRRFLCQETIGKRGCSQ